MDRQSKEEVFYPHSITSTIKMILLRFAAKQANRKESVSEHFVFWGYPTLQELCMSHFELV
jgi:hypothetical protein